MYKKATIYGGLRFESNRISFGIKYMNKPISHAYFV